MKGNKTNHKKRDRGYDIDAALSDTPEMIEKCLTCPYKECHPSYCKRLSLRHDLPTDPETFTKKRK